jgi:hypothetical protein
MDGFAEPVGCLYAPLGPQVDRRVDHRRLRHKKIDIRLRLFLHRHQHVLVPHGRIAVRELGHSRVIQPQFDAPQYRLDRASGQLPR